MDLQQRLEQHRSQEFTKSYTAIIAHDWELFLQIDDLEYEQARRIEAHIKAMKSTTYIKNLKKYPEIIEKLKEKYSLGSSR